MARPREAVADAIRTAREIVTREGAALALAARGADEGAVETASRDLAGRIAEAILEAEREAIERTADLCDGPESRHVATLIRLTA